MIKPKNMFLQFLLLVGTANGILYGAEIKLAEDANNKISVDSASGALLIHNFNGVKPQKAPIRIGNDVFTPVQMEKKAPSLRWKVENTAKDTVTLLTILDAKSAGIDLAGVEYRKTYTFNPAIPEITVKMEFRNITKGLRYAYWGTRNEYQLRQNVHEPIFVPASMGTFPVGSGLFLDFYSAVSPWTSAAVENWCAKLDPVTRRGLAFLPDWDTLSAFYSGAGKVAGFMIDNGYLAPGATKSVSFRIRPVKGFSAITTINDHFAAVLSVSGKKEMTLAVLPYANGMLEGKVDVIDKDRKVIASKAVKMTLKNGNMATVKIPHPEQKNHGAAVFTGIMNGQKFATEQYVENGYRMQAVPATEFSPYFMRSVPAKKQPENKIAAGSVKRQKKAVCFFGLYTDFNRFDKILNGWKIDIYSVSAPGMKSIPPASTLDEYSVMIMGNTLLSSMEVCLQRVASFVQNGGVLIVTGGPSAFGTGGYETNAILQALLPVAGKPFDLQPAAGKEKFDIGTLIKGIGISAGKEPAVYWYHRGMQLKKEAKVLWKSGSDPLLVKAAYGKGMVLCFTGSPLGDPQDGKMPYWDSPEYIKAMKQIVETTLREVQK